MDHVSVQRFDFKPEQKKKILAAINNISEGCREIQSWLGSLENSQRMIWDALSVPVWRWCIKLLLSIEEERIAFVLPTWEEGSEWCHESMTTIIITGVKATEKERNRLIKEGVIDAKNAAGENSRDATGPECAR